MSFNQRFHPVHIMFVLIVIAMTEISSAHSYRLGSGRNFVFQNQQTKHLARSPTYSYETKYLQQKVDHFGFENEDVYNQRYLIANQFWNKNGGPIFFYTGNEGDIELFCENTGFMWDIAPMFKALLVFAEHRYYGKSLPYGAESLKNASTLNYLTSEQALADFAELIKYLKSTVPGAANSQVIVFGGSYGGMLSAWMRIKYPNLVNGALAASAPIWQFSGLTPCNAFYDTTSATWQDASPTCVSNIHQSYSTLQETSAEAGGYDFISSTFKLCTPLKSKYDIEPFMAFLADTYVNYAMVNYPYPANFLADLPAWPVKSACEFLSKPMEGKALLVALSKVTNLYFNHTGKTQCVDWNGQHTNSSLGLRGWGYQSCTEMVMPMCSNNTGMFYNIPWNFLSYSDECYRTFKVKPRENWISLEYWAKQLQLTSNIIFSNGMYDPWSSGGVMQTVSESVIAIPIRYGAHHYDLRGKNDLDTPSVKEARTQETNILRSWLGITSN